MIRTHKQALEQSYSKELEAGHVVITCAAVMASVFEIGSDGKDSVREILWQTARERDTNFRECVFHFRLDRTRGRANVLEAKFLNGVYLGLRLGTNEMHIGTATCRQCPSDQAKDSHNVVSVFNAVVGAPRKPTPGAQRDGDEVPAARYPIAASGGKKPLPVRPAVRGVQGGVLRPRKVHIRAGVETEKCGANPGWRCDAILTRRQARSSITAPIKRITTEMQHDERLVRRVQAAEGRKRPRANPVDDRDAVRSRAT